ncbi:MAG TPA: twin-arginine translocase TatA/TatE family subunit [Actinomycetota bacterium]|nr:twin-arginine translocase TatA/TatE family subunit [Actinomycetota bacterium]
MMNFGPVKLIFTAVAALHILGPRRLPGAVRAAARALGELRRASSEVSRELRSGLEESGLGVEPDEKLRRVPPPPEQLRPGPRI